METTLHHVELALWLLLGSAWIIFFVIGRTLDIAAWAASTISSGHDFHSCRSLGLIIGPP
jgi:hypothetical protein